MVTRLTIIVLISILPCSLVAQEDDRSWRIGLFTGMVNYQGDLQPNSFSFDRAHFRVSGWVRKNFSNRLAAKAGIGYGTLAAADSYNRDYLQIRNLSFKSRIKEAFLSLDYTLLDLTVKRLSPFAYGDLVVFNFNPFTTDQQGNKVYLQPLSTEGQGLADYPDRKPYKLTQHALGFGGGLRFAANENLVLNLEAGQRKTFTDYLDDVSTAFVDRNKLLAARGAKAVELAFRGDEVNANALYPPEGEQRGTPTEMDWYYYFGLSAEIRIGSLTSPFSGLFGGGNRHRTGCPTVF